MLQILQGRQRALTGEPIKRPKQHRIELAAAGGLQHCLELDKVASLAGGFVRKFLYDLPTLPLAKLVQLVCLVANVLSFVLSAYPAVQSNSNCLLACHGPNMSHESGRVKNDLHINGRFCAANSATSKCLCFFFRRFRLQRGFLCSVADCCIGSAVQSTGPAGRPPLPGRIAEGS